MPADTLTSHLDHFREAATACPIPAAVELIGEKWAFLILRGAMHDLKHFEEFQAALGIARNILSDRLARLVAGGILERSSDPVDKRRIIYSLTPKGEALLPVLLTIRQWGLDWGCGDPNWVLCDKRDRKPIERLKTRSHDGRAIDREDLVWIDRRTTGDL